MSANQLVVRILARSFGLPMSVVRGRTTLAREVGLEARVAQRRSAAAKVAVVPSCAASPISGSKPSRALVKKQGRNEECACGSGKKFKYCCALQH
jgi:preprotein translocase subunit SecA